MQIDIATVCFLVALASLLHATALVGLYFLANQYRGIGIYTIGTLLSALAFSCFVLRWLNPEFLIFRLVGNMSLISAQICYAVGILRFLEKKECKFWIYFVIFLSTMAQVYYIYVDSNYLMRNISIISVLAVSYTIAGLELLRTQSSYRPTSNYFVASTLFLCSIFLILRIILLPIFEINALFESQYVNIFSFLLIFVVGYFRSSGFIMMVTQKLYQDLKAQACIDFLTKLPNRRALPPYFQDAIAQFQHHQIPFSIILIDIDRFKSINDTYGHDGGDAVLRHLSFDLPTILRSRDFLCRWGGEEFLILLPNTPLDEARQVAERLRHHVETHSAANGLIPYTISLGVAAFQDCHPNIEALISEVDLALYAAKNNGRNRVEVAQVKQP